MEPNLTLGQKIKRYRLINDIRQEDMAEKMGVSRATLINYEKGLYFFANSKLVIPWRNLS